MLAFASAVVNVGEGPLLVRGTRPSGAATMIADQLVQRDDGAQERRTAAGTLRFAPGGHNHWHLAGFQRFELRDPAGGRRVARDHTTGFCRGDRFRSRPPVPGSPRSPVINHNCARARPGARRLTMGITPGWGDDYVFSGGVR